MRRAIAVILVLSGLLAGTLLSAADATRADRIRRLCQPLVDAEVVVGLAVGVVDPAQAVGTGSPGEPDPRDQQAAREAEFFGFGELSAEGDRQIDRQTVFEIGSISKVFTALILADLVQRHVVALDDPVQKYLPDSVQVPSRDGRQITLVDLVTHSSGLPRMPNNFRPVDPGNPYADYAVEQLYDHLTHANLRHAPGERYAYSNLGAGLLGHALARAANQTYEELIVERICNPLDMPSTRIILSDEMRERLAPGHDADGNRVANWDLPTLAGAGGLRSCIDDLLAFLVAQLKLRETPLSAAIDRTHVARFEMKSPPGSIALGWHILPDGQVLWHNGQTGGYHGFVAIRPDRHVGVALLANTAAGMVDTVGFRLLRLVSGEEPEPLELRMPIVVEPAILDRYVGRYELSPGFELTISRDGEKLMAQATLQAKVRIYSQSETRFFYKIVDAQIEFVKDESGGVEKLILHQNGRDLPGKKLE